MIRFIFSLILMIVSFVVHAFPSDDLSVSVQRVVDGDTFDIIVLDHPQSLQQIKIRIRGIDAPEIFSYACRSELERGMLAFKELKNLLENKKVVLRNIRFDKYGGRVDADVFLFGKDVSKILLEKQLVVPYSGEGQRPSWCP